MIDITPLFATVLLICFGLICYSDLRWLIIPNTVNAIIMLTGLVYKYPKGAEAVLGALLFGIMVALLMWTIRQIHFRATGRVGLGLGDVKLAGAAAVWFSPLMFPLFLFLASALALMFVVAFRIKSGALHQKLPFGPFLAASLIATWTLELTFGPSLGSLL